MTYSDGQSLVANVLRANAPQAAVSFIYIFYNNVLTCMVGGHEYTRFASTRKSLRVSEPRGTQRSTFWLQLPYRYILPLMSAMAVLHWLIARSIFLVKITVYYPDQSLDPANSISACGYSTIALVFAVCLGGILTLPLYGLAFRKLDPGMPIAASCSLLLSAACHLGGNEENAALQPLKYGVVSDNQSNEKAKARVGFSSQEVAPLVSGVIYSRTLVRECYRETSSFTLDSWTVGADTSWSDEMHSVLNAELHREGSSGSELHI